MSPDQPGIVTAPVKEGLAKAGGGKAGGGKDLKSFDIGAYVRIRMGDDLQACRDAIKPELALYIGGMGARSKNFYNDFADRKRVVEGRRGAVRVDLGGLRVIKKKNNN